MRGSGLDLFDPRSTVMASGYTSSRGGSRDPDFGFAFNDSNFSDRVLRIEIVADPMEARPESKASQTLADWAARKSKRRRGNVAKKENDMYHSFAALDINNCPEEQILDCQPDAEEGDGDENHDEEEIPTTEDSPSGDEATHSDDSNWSGDGSRVLRDLVYEFFSSFLFVVVLKCMMESEQRHVTLRIHASEEAALMELLNFMYSSTLSINTAPALLDVLMAADKFEGKDEENSCIVSFLWYQDEVMDLPLAGVEAILSSDDLQVPSEDAVYDFVLKWTRTHYPKLEERRDVLCTRLAEAPHRQRVHAIEEETTSTSRRFIERVYKYRPVKVVEFEFPRHQCVVFLDLKREECANLFPSGRVYSQAFHLGGKARSKPTEDFISKYKDHEDYQAVNRVIVSLSFEVLWASAWKLKM
ncbi:BTB/POZ domain-containing protein POB1 [Sesamum angolense]|uniref:BTB/POZ domain-containing protein POB1 n=1 Tax=Sesamum angolense TaxID=2727404 RepID=A0AAE1T7L9_9LAMI|nr:BTB/POZ domain-containing protein POB1 [Sesamum angolense]